MRAGFGLIGILLVVGIIALWIGKGGYLNAVTSPEVKHAQQQANQIAGNSRDGSMRFSDSLSVETEAKNGKIASIDVTKVVPGGPADTDYGLKEGDAIVEIGELSVKDNIQSDSDAMGQLQQFGYSRSAPLKIIRDGNPMTLQMRNPGAKAQAQAKTPHSGGGGKDEIQQQIDMHQALPGMP